MEILKTVFHSAILSHIFYQPVLSAITYPAGSHKPITLQGLYLLSNLRNDIEFLADIIFVLQKRLR